MTTKNMAYDHPSYITRNVLQLGSTVAGAAAVTEKFTAFTGLTIFSCTAGVLATGTSTYASLWNGTATIATAVGAQTWSLVRVFNTAAAGASPALGTATYGPFVLSLYNGTATATQTNSSLPFFANTVQLYNPTGTGTGQQQAGTNTGNGGLNVNAGDIVYVVQGTDATATASYTLEFQITPLANVSN